MATTPYQNKAKRQQDKIVGSNEQQTYYPTGSNWSSGSKSSDISSGFEIPAATPSTKVVSMSAMAKQDNISYKHIDESELTDEELKRYKMPDSIKFDSGIMSSTSSNLWADESKRNELLDEDRSLIQNDYSFPYYIQRSHDNMAAKYDYKIIPGDSRYPKMVRLEDKLKEARASFGLHVHGNNEIGRAVKYNMYNRFKVPDTNMLFNRMTTHVFFTRPDLNLLNCCDGKIYGPNIQTRNHSDTSLLYKTNPHLFRLLTDGERCGDTHNFNLLLSQQVNSFEFGDEELSATEVGKSWGGNSIYYGNNFTGRKGGEFSCQFEETDDLSIIKLMKLWITYIDNVSNGAWSPSYDLHGDAVKDQYGSYNPAYVKYQFSKNINGSHAYTNTIDYGASVYVLKCGPTGSDVLYWTKYFGVFPIVTGSSALSWTGEPIGSSIPKLNIRFKYGFKKDLSMTSLVEFNEQSGITNENVNKVAESSYSPLYNHSSRPFVGAPFIEITDSRDHKTAKHLGSNSEMYGEPTTKITLKFLKPDDPRLTDELLYRGHCYNPGANINKTKLEEVLLC